MKNKITVVDAICGSGKSTYFFNMMNDEKDKRFIYITPYLDEVDRCIEVCDNRYFEQPKNIGKGKLENLNSLLKDGKNIASTHSLFRLCNNETLRLLKEMDYTLILDEVMDIIEVIKISKDDLEHLKEKYVSIDDKGKISWLYKAYEGEFDKIKESIENGDVYLIRDKFVLWTFPIGVFKSLRETFILTYLFDGQIQRYYYDMNNVKYEYKSIKKIDGNYNLVEYDSKEDLSHIRDRINIYEGKLNKIGESTSRSNALSSSWFDNQIKKKLDGVDILRGNIYNYFNNIIKESAKDNMWTVYKSAQSKLKGKGYTKGFVTCNARATNEYVNKKNLAYCINIFNNPFILGFFIDKGVNVNQETYALSELVQWIFRSNIRKGGNINIYIPSDRMRELLQNWLGN